MVLFPYNYYIHAVISQENCSIGIIEMLYSYNILALVGSK